MSQPAERNRVGVIGLGLLGTALAERLIGADFEVVVNNRTRSKADPLIRRGATWSDDPLADCDRVVICLYTTQVVQEVLNQLGSSLRSGQILIDTTTGQPHQAASMAAELTRHGVTYLESPIAASSEQTRRGQAMAIVAGQRAAFDACQDIFAAIAPKRFFVGPAGNAAKMKLVNNLILGLNRVALAEGLAFAEAVGVSMAEALAVVKQGNAYSVAMDVKGRKMAESDFSLQAKLSQHLKDVRLILNNASQCGLQLPFSTLHCRTLEDLEAAGLGELDNSAIIRAFQRGTARAAADRREEG